MDTKVVSSLLEASTKSFMKRFEPFASKNMQELCQVGIPKLQMQSAVTSTLNLRIDPMK